ncbi:hypothetical protein D3C80_1474760 [compost metagenome]
MPQLRVATSLRFSLPTSAMTDAGMAATSTKVSTIPTTISRGRRLGSVRLPRTSSGTRNCAPKTKTARLNTGTTYCHSLCQRCAMRVSSCSRVAPISMHTMVTMPALMSFSPTPRALRPR